MALNNGTIACKLSSHVTHQSRTANQTSSPKQPSVKNSGKFDNDRSQKAQSSSLNPEQELADRQPYQYLKLGRPVENVIVVTNLSPRIQNFRYCQIKVLKGRRDDRIIALDIASKTMCDRQSH